VKYNNNPCTSRDGISFHSEGERDRYEELRLLEKAGDVRALQLQVPYRIEINGQLVCTYKADFVYEQRGRVFVEDFKGFKTETYNLKKKLMRAVLGIEIVESYSAKRPKKDKWADDPRVKDQLEKQKQTRKRAWPKRKVGQ
jgi:hypothetical protein